MQAAEFLDETQLLPEREYTFTHALTHEVAYDSPLQARRHSLHTRIVDALGAFSSDRVAEQVERLAHHAFLGEMWEKAIPYCRQAGEKALARSAHREAVVFFEQALRGLSHLPEERTTREHALEQSTAIRRVDFQASCRLALGEAQVRTGQLEEARTLAERALVHAHERQEWGHQAYAHRLLGDIMARRDPPDRESAEAHYRQALALAERLGMRPLQAHCHDGLATLYAQNSQRVQDCAELASAIELYRTMEMTCWLTLAKVALAQMEAR